MVDQHVITLFIHGKTVVPWAELAVGIAGAKHRFAGLMPLCRIEEIGIDVCPQQADAIILVGGAGRVADEDPLTVFDHRRAFVHPKPNGFPRQLRFAQHHRGPC
ncbi:hypothetical protein D3C77_598490 [compost metagenome]